MSVELPEPSFVERDPNKVLAECIAFVEQRYEELGMPRVLLPTSVERILIDLIAYRENLIRIAIQDAAKQNLRAYARFPMLDYLAEIIGAERIDPKPSLTTLRFTLPDERVESSPIDAGTRIRSRDGRVEFVTSEFVEIAEGDLTADVAAHASVAGVEANGYAPGQIAVLIDDLGFEVEVENITITADGAAAEDTEQLRERFPLAVQALSVAGPKGAYRFLALSAHPNILDVAVLKPADGTVELVVLSKTGTTSSEMLDAVVAACDDEDVRPYTDTVIASAAVAVDYEIVARVTLRRNAHVARTVEAVEKALDAYAKERSLRLRQPPIDSAMKTRASVPGVVEVELDEPGTVALSGRQWARCTGIEVIFEGFEVDAEEDA